MGSIGMAMEHALVTNAPRTVFLMRRLSVASALWDMFWILIQAYVKG